MSSSPTSSSARQHHRVLSLFSLLLLALFASSSYAALLPRGQHDGAVAPTLEARALLEERQVDSKAKTQADLVKRAAQASYYTALVAFGASYTDNAHPRDAAFSGSLRQYYPYQQHGGRYSNGPVAVEWMVGSVSPALAKGSNPVKLLGYAYGGSHIDNSFTGGSSPATKDQIAQYLGQVNAGTAAVGQGRVLHYVNSGINSLSVIWSSAVSAGLTSAAISNAKAQVTKNVNALATQMRSINTNAAVFAKVHGADYMIVGIPPLEIVPSFIYQAGGNANSLSLLKTLSAQYNAELKNFATAFKSQTRNGKVFYYDLAALWRIIHSNPAYAGVTASPVTTTCYNSSTGGVCTNPAQHLYFDSLHPTTTINRLMASKINAVVKNGW